VSEWVNTQIAFNGLVQGTVYGLLALSIVLIYRSSRVINFAVGSMGVVGSSLLVLLDLNYGVPFWLALLIGLLVGMVFSAIVELVVIRRLFRAPRVIVLVATIGVSQLALAIVSALPDIEEVTQGYPQAIGSSWEVRSVQVKGAQVLVLVVAPILAAALAWFLNRTLMGRTVRAAAGNPDLARLRGVNPKTLSTVVWAVSGVVGTISLVLIGSLNASAASLGTLGPVSLFRALVAALFGKFLSFPRALAAGVVIGLVESILRFHFIDAPGVIDVVLLVAVLVLVSTTAKERVQTDAVFAFSPKVESIPERLRGIWWVRNLDRLALLVPLAAAVALPLVFDQPSRQLLYASITAFAICALSLTVLTGWAGQLSLGQMAFAGIGALVAAAFTRGMEVDWSFGNRQLIYLAFDPVPFALSFVLASAITAGMAAVIGVGALRVRGLLLAVSTFGFAIAAGSWMYRNPVLSGGSSTSARFSRGDLFGIDLLDNRTYYYVVLSVLVVTMALLGRLRRSGVGRVTIAVRDNPNSAAAYTIRPEVAKLRAFALSGAIAGLGGALLAGSSQQLTFGDDRFLVSGSLAVVSMIVIGGMGSIAGAVVGAIWVVGLPTLAPDNDVVPLLASSLGLLILLLYFPGGFAHIAYRVRSAIYRRLEADLPPVEKSAAGAPVALQRHRIETVTAEVPLRVSGVTVTYGGVKANDDISIEVRRDEIVGLIGTNGAGKTTLMNAVGGYVPSSGRVELLGEDVSGSSPAMRARKGLGRTFQAATLFPELTVREAVEVACEARGRSGLVETALFSPRARSRSRAQRATAAELVDFLGLGRYADRSISELSTGTRRIVELAGLLALDARVLCLDEPTAGIAQREAEAMGPLLVEIRKELGASMLIIEHDMPLVMGMSDRIYCLEQGRVLAEGPPDAVRNDKGVVASYLGMDERTIARSGAAGA
jgi:ABC-type branched-subunit amino acid transport system ATPase component/ABC-type branched-subunit amino acid transport system permease subunit